MFEQKLQDQEIASQDASPVQLFKDYEIKSWNVSTRIYQILGASVFLNLIAILVMGQSNLLTRKGCDSPLVGSVCQVLDMVYLGSDVLGTNTQYIDGEFVHTDLGDADITYLDLTGIDPPLKYPDGYFALANPGSPVETIETSADGGFPNIPGISKPVPSTGANLSGMPQVTPTPNSKVVDGSLPPPDVNDADPNPTVARIPGIPGGRRGFGGSTRGTTSKTPKPTPDPTATATATTDDGLPSIVINRDALKLYGEWVKGEIAGKNVDLSSQFDISATGKLDKDGKIIKDTFKYNTVKTADPEMVNIVRAAIEAVNDSGYLKWLSEVSGKDLTLSIAQDSEFLTGTVETSVESPRRANTLRTLFKLYIDQTVKKKMRPEATADDKDDLDILNNAQVETNGNKVIIQFRVPKAVAQALIKKKLIDNSAAQEPLKPSGATQTKAANTTAGK
jgi:hypothetical protein